MPNIKEILGWHWRLSNLQSFAEKVISQKTKDTLRESEGTLIELASKLPPGVKLPEKRQLENIYQLFMENRNDKISELRLKFSKRETRFLIGILDFVGDPDEPIIIATRHFKTVLKVIDSKWRDAYIIYLFHFLLRNWEVLMSHRKNMTRLKKILKDKTQNYKGTRKDIVRISENIDHFLHDDSPSRYLNLLEKADLRINEAHSLIGQRESILGYSFFHQIVILYVQSEVFSNFNKEDFLSIYNYLYIQKNQKFNLIICSHIINNELLLRYQDEIKDNTVRLIADPVVYHKWRHADLSESQRFMVEKARNRLNTWMNDQLIKLFFEELVQDQRRKKYWLKFSEEIDDIKFCGNLTNYLYLKGFEGMSDLLSSRYKITKHYQKTSALIIYSKNFVFVEFTDSGAIYIYKDENFKINLNSVYTMRDLKKWPVQVFACKVNQNSSYYGGYYETKPEGRIVHNGDWESKVNAWMRNHYD
jgi:hypothetical protein